MATTSDHLQTLLDNLPTRPGCYLMKDGQGKIIYVGKAVNLRNRVRSYFHASADHNAKTRELVSRIEDIEWIVVASELEALLLEYNLISRHKPKYNVRWKDDKKYPYIKVHWGDPFPKVSVTRRMEMDHGDGARYFGPYTSVWAVHQSLDTLRKIFPYLTCDRVITGQDARACLYKDIKLCNAPCVGAATQAEYRAMINDLCRFLYGNTKAVVERLQAEMARASEELRYEKAAAIRDQLLAIERIVEKQKIISQHDVNSDVVAFARDGAGNDACVQVFFIRAGKLIGRDYFVLEGTADENDGKVLSAFLKQFYHKAAYVPPEVLLPDEAAEAQIIQQWLRDRRGGKKVSLSVPRRGAKRELVQMAAENAAEVMATLRAQWEADSHKQETALAELQSAFGLSAPPNRMECYDISNTQGDAATGSMVVFHRGVPRKSHYRRFTIRTVQGPDDYASMREVLTRRFQRWRDIDDVRAGRTSAAPGKKPDESFARLPDLLVVDGGKGQLGIASEVLQAFELNDRVPLVSLAKREEEVFVPGKRKPVLLPRRSQGLFLLQRLRDEAHRFALAHHRTRRRKAGVASQLDAIRGIGPARRRALLTSFGSLEGIRAASVEELARVKGMSFAAAQAVKASL
ncbi:MAG: excinuclease ABC subunit UvrC [Anaerolineales bacterium]